MRRLRSMNRCRSLKANVLKREAVAVKKTANRCRTSRTNVLKREVVPVKKKKPSDKCVTCGLAFSSDFNLARHRRNAHSEQVGEFKCLHCSRSFILESRLKMHVSIAHFRYQCSLCPSSFKNEAFKTLHEEKMHSGNSNYVCKICNSTFNKMNSLAYHMSRHHSTSKQTSPRAKLDAKPKPGVMKAVSAAKTTKNGVAMVYANELCCSYCPKFLSHPESKVRHEKLHTGNHPYACKFCKASFHLIDTWRRHERVCLQLHTALWCKFCDFYTFETASLVMHYRKRHGAKFESPAELEFLRRECLRGPTADVVPERDACSEHDESETSEDGAEMEQDDHVGSDSDGNFEETFQNHVPEMFSNNEVPVEDENAQRSRNVGISRINGGVVRIIPSRDLQSASEESDRIVGAGGEYNVQSNRGTVIAQISDKLDEMFRNCVQPASENTTREKIDATVEVCSEKNVQRSRDASISQINDQLHEMFRDDADQLASEDITRDKIDAMVEVRGGTNAHRSQDPSISRINDQLVEIFGDDDDQPASENATRETILETVEVDGESNAQRNQNADISQINDQLEEMFQDDDAVQPVSEEINAIEVSTNVEQPACEIAQSQPIDDLMRVLQSSEIRPVEQIKPQLDTIVEQKVVDSQSAVREDLVDEKWIKYEVEVAQLDNKLREIFQNDKIIENYATSEYEVTQSPEPCRVIDLTTEDDEHEHPIITIDDD